MRDKQMSLDKEVWNQKHHVYLLALNGQTIVKNKYMNGDEVSAEIARVVSASSHEDVIELIMPFADSHTFARVFSTKMKLTVQTISCCRDIHEYDLILFSTRA